MKLQVINYFHKEHAWKVYDLEGRISGCRKEENEFLQDCVLMNQGVWYQCMYCKRKSSSCVTGYYHGSVDKTRLFVVQSLSNMKLRESTTTKKGNLWGYKEKTEDTGLSICTSWLYTFQLNLKWLRGIYWDSISINTQHWPKGKRKIGINCCLYTTQWWSMSLDW